MNRTTSFKYALALLLFAVAGVVAFKAHEAHQLNQEIEKRINVEKEIRHTPSRVDIDPLALHLESQGGWVPSSPFLTFVLPSDSCPGAIVETKEYIDLARQKGWSPILLVSTTGDRRVAKRFSRQFQGVQSVVLAKDDPFLDDLLQLTTERRSSRVAAVLHPDLNRATDRMTVGTRVTSMDQKEEYLNSIGS